MYSVVLATMLTAGASAPDWHWRSCHSCYSSCSSSCGWGGHHRGYYCHGCSACYGCYSGGYGGYAGGYGYSSYYCGGGYCHGGFCSGGVVIPSCSCYGLHGHGFSHYGYGYADSYCSCAATYGGCGTYYGGVVVTPPGTTPSTNPPTPPQPMSPAPPPPPVRPNATPTSNTAPTSAYPDRAQIVVHLPVEAKLTVDNVFCPIQGETRTFNTPVLRDGAQYYYELQITHVRDGQSVTQQKKITMSAGQRIEVDFRPSVEAAPLVAVK